MARPDHASAGSTPVLPWREFGRPWPTDAREWTVWLAPLEGSAGCLYRSLTVAEAAISVIVDLHAGDGSGLRLIHRSRSALPDRPDEIADRVVRLLAAADAAAAKFTQNAGRDGGGPVGSSPHVQAQRESPSHRPGELYSAPEQHIRERAYFLWEQEGRPIGRAEEFWERACRDIGLAA